MSSDVVSARARPDFVITKPVEMVVAAVVPAGVPAGVLVAVFIAPITPFDAPVGIDLPIVYVCMHVFLSAYVYVVCLFVYVCVCSCIASLSVRSYVHVVVVSLYVCVFGGFAFVCVVCVPSYGEHVFVYVCVWLHSSLRMCMKTRSVSIFVKNRVHVSMLITIWNLGC